MILLNIKHMLQITCIHLQTHTHTKALCTEARDSRPNRCSLSHVRVLKHNTNQTPPRSHACTLLSYSPLCMHSALVAQVRMLRVRRAWRSGPGGLEVLWGRRGHFLPEAEPGAENSSVRAEEEGGGGGEGEDALSREEFPECCPLIWSQPHTLSTSLTLTLSFSLPRLYLTSSGFSVTMRKGRGVSDRQRDRLKMQSS